MACVTMNEIELTRLRVLQDLMNDRTTLRAAAQLLGISFRHLRRLRARFVRHGPAGLVSGKRGKPGNRNLPASLRERALDLVRTCYADFGPTFACQKLRERHGIHLSSETLRKWMLAKGLWVHRKMRRQAVHQPRYRRECLGELVQIDGSQHAWFEARGPRCTLLVYIDDATSRLMHLRFTETESVFSYFTATAEYLRKHGKPVAFYSDKHSIFRVTHKGAVGGSGMTQFGRALHELNIDIICANTPQAKGRVERANRTLQDRLVKELRLAGASNLQEGNAFLPTFMADYNARFSRIALNAKDLHRPLAAADKLEDIFVWREERTVSASLTLQYDKVLFMLEPDDLTRALARKRVTVSDYPDGRVVIGHNGVSLPYRIFDKVRHVDQGAIVDNKHLAAALEYIRRQQTLHPAYRSEKAPHRRGQENSIFLDNAPLSQKRKARHAQLHSMEKRAAHLKMPAGLSYEDELCLEIGRRMRAEQEQAAAERRRARQKSRLAYLHGGSA
jgi:hypothetical protein